MLQQLLSSGKNQMCMLYSILITELKRMIFF